MNDSGTRWAIRFVVLVALMLVVAHYAGCGERVTPLDAETRWRERG